MSDEAVQLDWVYNDDFIVASCRTNVVIAAYTTTQTRLKLYSYLEKNLITGCYTVTQIPFYSLHLLVNGNLR